MRLVSTTPHHLLGGVVLLTVSFLLAACAGGTEAPVTGVTSTPQQHSPLAAPPSSMMTPHGY